METGYADGKGPPSPSYLKGSLVTGKVSGPPKS